MKRILMIAAAALITSATAFAGWGPNGQYGNAIPGSKPVGQSSTPSTNPASAPITTPFNPNSDLGNVPGSFQDKADKGQLGGISSKIGYNPNKPMHTPGQNQSTSSRPSRQRPFPTTQTNNNYPQYPKQYPTNMNNYPQYPQQTQYPTNMNSGYPKGNSYPHYPQQHSTSSNSGWDGYGGQSSTGSSSWGPVSSGSSSQASTSSWGGYGGQANNQYGMFGR